MHCAQLKLFSELKHALALLASSIIERRAPCSRVAPGAREVEECHCRKTAMSWKVEWCQRRMGAFWPLTCSVTDNVLDPFCCWSLQWWLFTMGTSVSCLQMTAHKHRLTLTLRDRLAFLFLVPELKGLTVAGCCCCTSHTYMSCCLCSFNTGTLYKSTYGRFIV